MYSFVCIWERCWRCGGEKKKQKNKWVPTARSAVNFVAKVATFCSGTERFVGRSVTRSPWKRQCWFSFGRLKWLMMTFLLQVSKIGKECWACPILTTDNEVCLLPAVKALFRFYHRPGGHFPVTSHSGWKTKEISQVIFSLFPDWLPLIYRMYSSILRDIGQYFKVKQQVQ